MNPIGALIRVVLPIIFIYLAFSVLGTIGGFAALVLFIAIVVYLNRAIIYQNRASKKYHNGDFDGALKDLKSAVSFDPKKSIIRGNYAYMLLKLGHTEEAATEIEEALKYANNNVTQYTLRVTKGLVLWKQNKLDDAVKELEDLLTVYKNTNVYAALGFIYIEKGDIKKALEFNLESKEYNGSSAIILDNLGTTYILLEDYENAMEIFKNAMKLKPSFPEAYFNYARVLDKTGDLEKALYMTRYALTLRFWNTSTIKKSDVEAFLAYLEEKEKEEQLKAPKKSYNEAQENDLSETVEVNESALSGAATADNETEAEKGS